MIAENIGAFRQAAVGAVPAAARLHRARHGGPLLAFWLKDGVNLRRADPGYEGFRGALALSARSSAVAFCFADATVNREAGPGASAVRYVRSFERTPTRDDAAVPGEGSECATISLPAVAIRARGAADEFRAVLVEELQAAGRRLQRQGAPRPVVGFTGLAEALLVLTGSHHGWSEEARTVGLAILALMRRTLDAMGSGRRAYALMSVLERRRLPWLGTRFRYGLEAWDVPDLYQKIAAEAPLHRYCDGGHVTILHRARRYASPEGLERLLLHAREHDAGCVWPR